MTAAFLVAGTHSGVGKTSVALGLARALARQGTRVQGYKVGPDYLDPTWMKAASGRVCFNLDPWMSSEAHVRELFASHPAEVQIVEGVMGLFDGASPSAIDGSSAHVAKILDLPVILVVDVASQARSIAAAVKGFCAFETGVRIEGVIANRCGSEVHAAIVREALASSDCPPLLGWIPKGGLPSLPARHLGLVCAEEADGDLDALADAIEQHLDLASFKAATSVAERRHSSATEVAAPIRVGIAHDEAFSFYYQANLDALAQAGVEWVPFSPLHDTALPESLDGLYLGGGYPELHADTLASNRPMREAIRTFPGAIYAECGGLIALCEHILTAEAGYEAIGLLATDARMLPQRKRLGYTTVTCTADCAIGPAGHELRGHEFHYSELVASPDADPVYRLTYRDGTSAAEGYRRDRLLASYVHLYWADAPVTIAALVDFWRTA